MLNNFSIIFYFKKNIFLLKIFFIVINLMYLAFSKSHKFKVITRLKQYLLKFTYQVENLTIIYNEISIL